MAILEIVRMGHPVLLQHAMAIPDPTAPEVSRLAADLIETMHHASGVGLAAPQVGVSARIFVFQVPSGRQADDGSALPEGDIVLINPQVHCLEGGQVSDWEGCLSIPGLRAMVPRAMRIAYSGIDLDGRLIQVEASGFHARVVQHEFDHLNGLLYPMRVTDFTRFGFADELLRAEMIAQS